MKQSIRRIILSATLAILLLGVFGWPIYSHGGLVNALHLPPVRDSSTPETQNGFTLLDIQSPEDQIGNFHYSVSPGQSQELYGGSTEYAVAGLWVQVPEGSGNDPKTFHVTAHAASGETFSLRAYLSLIYGSRPILFVSLPGCYAGTLRYVDVTFSDDDRQSATWRIDRLPTMQHVISPPVAIQETYSTPGIKLVLHASLRSGKIGRYVRCQLYPQAAVDSHQWELSMTRDMPETDWMPFLSDTTETSTLPLTGEAAKSLMALNHGAMLDQFIDHPYVLQDHFVQLRGHLKQYETYDETVTFHKVQIEEQDAVFIFTVKQRQSVTTPSGITVTLPTQSKATFMHQGVLTEPGLLVSVEPHDADNQLPNSPLARQYNKPVHIDILPAKPFGLLEWTIGPGAMHKLDIFVPHSQLTTASDGRDMKLVVRQRVDLQSIPLTLTAPVKDITGANI